MSEAGAIGPVIRTSAPGYAGRAVTTDLAAQPTSSDAPRPTTAVVEIVPRSQDTLFAARSQHMSAAFVAHLIATDAQHPQTRERRRADPADATTAYTETSRLVRRRGF